MKIRAPLQEPSASTKQELRPGQGASTGTELWGAAHSLTTSKLSKA